MPARIPSPMPIHSTAIIFACLSKKTLCQFTPAVRSQVNLTLNTSDRCERQNSVNAFSRFAYWAGKLALNVFDVDLGPSFGQLAIDKSAAFVDRPKFSRAAGVFDHSSINVVTISNGHYAAVPRFSELYF